MTPTLAIIKNGVTHSTTICNDGEELERLFMATCSSYGVEAVDENFDDGYMELECGTSICMCWADKVNNIDTYIKEL